MGSPWRRKDSPRVRIDEAISMLSGLTCDLSFPLRIQLAAHVLSGGKSVVWVGSSHHSLPRAASHTNHSNKPKQTASKHSLAKDWQKCQLL